MKQLDLESEDERLITMLRALGNPARYRIFQELRQQETEQSRSLGSILPLAQSTVSEHLRRLKDAGLVTGEGERTTARYVVDEDALAWFRRAVETL